jgi:hypothetical protein
MSGEIKYDGPFSLIIGKRTYLESFITDDATDPEGQGGCQSIAMGEYGSGKTTLMLEMAENAHYVARGSKRGYIHALVHGKSTKGFKIKPTTVLWRIRDADGWPVLIPENWLQRYPGSCPKPVKVFVYKDDINHITFFHKDTDHNPTAIPNMPKVLTYSDADNLIDQMEEGAIHCVLEPQEYRLSKNLCSVVEQSLAEYSGGAQMDDRQKDDLENMPKKGRGRPIRVKDFSKIAIVSGVFWFDVTNSLMTRWGGKPVHVLADESDDYASQLSSAAHYHLVSKYCSWARDFRKLNISTTMSCHGWGLLHDQIYKRANIKIMMRGCKKSENCLIKYTRIFSGLERGFFIVERSNIEFGVFHFPPIINMMQCRIDGLHGASRFFSDYIARKIRSKYLPNPSETSTINIDRSHIGNLIEQMAAVNDEISDFAEITNS